MADDQATKNYNFERLFLKDLSFETPMGANVFAGEWDPDYRIKLTLNIKPLADNTWEVVLVANAGAKLGDNTAYLVEAQQGSVVTVAEIDQESLRRTLAVDVPTIIFPYLREVVDNVVVKGGFPSLGMSRPDFASLHEKAEEQASLRAGQP